MIITRLMGGLGNQMFQYATGRALATHYGKELFLDTSWFLGDTANKPGAKRFFMLDKFKIQARIINERRFFKVYKQKNDRLLVKLNLCNLKIFTLFNENLNMPFNNEVFLTVNKNIYLDGYWQTEKYFKSISNEIRKEFSLHKRLNKDDKKIIQEFRRTNSVSIHIRRGDYVNNEHTKKFHGLIPIQHYKKCITFFLDTIKNPSFYIFSDDPEWCLENLDFLENIKVISNNKRPPQEEMVLMSNCKHQIIANSSFSWWAAWLNNNKAKIVVAPRNWSDLRNEIFIDIIPESWIKY